MRQGTKLDLNPTRPHHIPKKWGRYDKTLSERTTVLDESAWEDFVLLAKVCVIRNPEATIYDVFDTWRTRILGGWEFSPEFVNKLDAQIEEEENGRNRVI